MAAAPFPLSPSLWAATAPPAPSTPPLSDNIRADVAVVGGGYMGLSTALHLAERGVRVVVLEAHEPGWGASGRNGGQVIPGLKYDPDEMEAMFGPERGAKLAAFSGTTADVVFDLIAKHKMDVPHSRAGWIQGAHDQPAIDTAKKRAEQWARRGAPVELLDKAKTAELLGTDSYLAGWLDKRGGGVQPLAYARGLARAAQAAGAVIHGQSRVDKLQRSGGTWRLTTGQGATVTADKVVLATNAYSGDLWPKVARSLIAVNSFQVATAPLSDNVRRSILPGGHVSSDTRKLLFYFRLDHEGRLLMGGRGFFHEPQNPEDWGHLERALFRMYPQAAGADFSYRWCGRVAITQDFLPHLYAPVPGLLIDVGCQGRGVGLQSAMGKAVAAYIATGDAEALPLPTVPVRAIPFHGLHKTYVSALIAWYRMIDGGLLRLAG